MYTWCILYTFALLLWTCVGHCILFRLNQPKTLIATPDIAWIWKSHEPWERSAASAKNQSVVHEEHKSGHCEELKEDPASHLSSAGILLFLAIHFLCWIVFINLDLAMRSKKHVNKFYRSRLVQSVWVKLPQPCHFRLGPMGLLQITSPLGVLMWHAMRSFHCNRESQDLCGRILADDFSSTGGRRLLSMSESSIGNGSTRFFLQWFVWDITAAECAEVWICEVSGFQGFCTQWSADCRPHPCHFHQKLLRMLCFTLPKPSRRRNQTSAMMTLWATFIIGW